MAVIRVKESLSNRVPLAGDSAANYIMNVSFERFFEDIFAKRLHNLIGMNGLSDSLAYKVLEFNNIGRKDVMYKNTDMQIPKSFSLLTLIVILYFSAGAQIKAQNTGSLFSTADVQQFLDHHNQARAELKISALRWNPELAAYAQEWANYLARKKKCKMIHRFELKENTAGYGENIFWGSSAKFFTPLDASIAWYNEKEKFNGGPITWEELPKTGHYTQMIWNKTTDVGAGKAVCPSGAIIVVANYNPAGNIIGSHP